MKYKKYFAIILLIVMTYYLVIQPVLSCIFPSVNLPTVPGQFGNLISIIVSIITSP